MELAIAFDLSFDPVEQVTLEFLYASTSQTSHVHVIALRTALIEVAFPLYMQQVQLVHQPVPLQQRKRAVDRHPIDVGIDLGRLAQDLRGIQMLFCRLDNFQDDLALTPCASLIPLGSKVRSVVPGCGSLAEAASSWSLFLWLIKLQHCCDYIRPDYLNWRA